MAVVMVVVVVVFEGGRAGSVSSGDQKVGESLAKHARAGGRQWRCAGHAVGRLCGHARQAVFPV